MTFSLYIHWPYCRQKCPYCDFNVHIHQHTDEAILLRSYLRELETYAAMLEPRAQKLSSVFFGGGTPSLMHASSVETILTHAEKLFGFTPNSEISLEANPTSAESQKLAAFKNAGINRLSMGIQSFDDTALKLLGRSHTSTQAKNAVERAEQVFSNFSFDLIYARPNQTLNDWQAELSEALAFNPPHMSLYQLTIEPNTQFHTLVQTGRITPMPDEESLAFYEATQHVLNAHAMPAYEISNHAKAGFECQHNLNYWQGGEYIGIGAGAHGRLNVNGQRLATSGHRAPEVWAQRVSECGHGSHAFEALSDLQQLEEQLMFGLRLKSGMPLPQNPHFNLSAAQNLHTAGFITLENNWLKTTEKGRLLVTSLIEKLVTDQEVPLQPARL